MTAEQDYLIRWARMDSQILMGWQANANLPLSIRSTMLRLVRCIEELNGNGDDLRFSREYTCPKCHALVTGIIEPVAYHHEANCKAKTQEKKS